MTGPVHVIGASGRSGLTLCHALGARGETVIPVIRNPGRAPQDLPTARIADLTGPTTRLAEALSDARVVISTAHARHIPAILAATRPDTALIALGSTRKFTRWPDAHGNGVLRGERALLISGRPGVILHPTMIYGAQGEDNVQRLVPLLRRLPIVPLPAGGRSLVQPIHQSDVTRSILAALDRLRDRTITTPESIVIAGPEPIPYRDFVAAIAKAAGLPEPRILSVPSWILMAAAPLATYIPRLPKVGVSEIRRLLEDKAFDITPMRHRLGINPLSLFDGLARLFDKI